MQSVGMPREVLAECFTQMGLNAVAQVFTTSIMSRNFRSAHERRYPPALRDRQHSCAEEVPSGPQWPHSLRLAVADRANARVSRSEV